MDIGKDLQKAYDEGYADSKADTVRKMQERLAKTFLNDDDLKYIEVDADYIIEKIDQIAEEMIGETK